MAYTRGQRSWFLRVYSQTSGYPMCHFPIYSEECGWGYCGSTSNLHVHHVIPQRFFRLFVGDNPNTSDNGILLCAKHHVGKGYKGSLDWRNEVVYVVHPDIAWAFQHYNTLKREAFDKVFKGRDEIAGKGKTYWNTDWDKALKEIASTLIDKYKAEHREDPFPD